MATYLIWDVLDLSSRLAIRLNYAGIRSNNEAKWLCCPDLESYVAVG